MNHSVSSCSQVITCYWNLLLLTLLNKLVALVTILIHDIKFILAYILVFHKKINYSREARAPEFG